MGSSLQHNPDRSVVSTGTTIPYQCTGVASCHVCCSGLCKGQTEHTYTIEDGQYISSMLCQMNGGNTLPQPNAVSLSTVAMVPSKGYYPDSLSPLRMEQSRGRLGISRDSIIDRVDAPQDSLQCSFPKSQAIASRLVCHSIESAVHQLETRSCTANWKDLKEYAFPPFAFIGKCLQKVRLEGTTVVLIALNLADTTLISAVIRNANGIPATLTTEQDIVRETHGTTPPIDCARGTEVDHLESIQQQHTAVGISEQASGLILARWSRGTNKTYQSGQKR